METKTLPEVCAGTEASRPAIQGYEKTWLVSASGKNKYGCLTHGQTAEEQIRSLDLKRHRPGEGRSQGSRGST